ncbi:MAG TPA: fused MFS/spermidine synthase [Gemmataceae bacterium]|nr:fused MFS/spermidine synthase [Gemmataceae bacterium]
MARLYALTLLVGALLLFAVQPMVGRMLLPALGGSPAVWNTCLVFFQGVLLLGYLYAHLLTRHLSIRKQAMLHLTLLAVVFVALPIAVWGGAPSEEAPALWLLATLTATVGLPFFALSTTSPLLQRWFSATRSRRARDPYFLSVASNVGCLAALIAYPIVIEPMLGLMEQANWWRWGYVGYVGLVTLCALAIRRRTGEPGASATGVERGQSPPVANVPDSPLRWLVLAFIPASLLTGVTQAITTDVAPMPLLWVVPLGLYLVTFIIAFTPRTRLPFGIMVRMLAVAAIAFSLTLLSGATEPWGAVLGVHLVTFFLAALVCHGRLAATRPGVERLTSFYMWMSLGGVLGGAFNALVAPIIFHRLGFVEYPVVVLVACLVRGRATPQAAWRDVVGPVMLGLGVVSLVLLAQLDVAVKWAHDLSESTGLPADMIRAAGCYGIPLLAAYTFVERPLRFALGLGALFLAGVVDPGPQGRPLHVERNFLGVVKITTSLDGQFTRMVHGSTIHGQQRNNPRPQYVAAFALPVGATSPLNELSILAATDGRWDDRHRPSTYYYPTGPAGMTFRLVVDLWQGPRRVGAVGLGTGALASYARPNHDWTFFELDPAVERLARDERYFTYLRDSSARSMNVVIGDARLRLAAEPDGSFDLLVLDAFSSDAIPIHLLTVEAFAMYERKLAPGGVILLHLSNNHLDLPPVVARVAVSMTKSLVVREYADLDVSERDGDDGKLPSVWMIAGRRLEDLGPLGKPNPGFVPVRPWYAPPWTDDRADLLRALKRGDE